MIKQWNHTLYQDGEVVYEKIWDYQRRSEGAKLDVKIEDEFSGTVGEEMYAKDFTIAKEIYYLPGYAHGSLTLSTQSDFEFSSFLILRPSPDYMLVRVENGLVGDVIVFCSDD